MWCTACLSFLAVNIWLGHGARVDAAIPSKSWQGWPRYIVCGGQYFDSTFLATCTNNASDTGNVSGRVRFWTTLVQIPVPALQEKAVLTVYLSFFEEAEVLVWNRALYTVYDGETSVIGPAHFCDWERPKAPGRRHKHKTKTKQAGDPDTENGGPPDLLDPVPGGSQSMLDWIPLPPPPPSPPSPPVPAS